MQPQGSYLTTIMEKVPCFVIFQNEMQSSVCIIHYAYSVIPSKSSPIVTLYK